MYNIFIWSGPIQHRRAGHEFEGHDWRSLLLDPDAFAPAAVFAENIYQAMLLPSLVVPPSGENAYGTATLIVSDDGLHAAYTVNFAGLQGSQTAALLMNAPAGFNGPVLLGLPLGTPVAGTDRHDPGAFERARRP